MPPSPSSRFPVGREPRMERHKRGRSFESGLAVKTKDEDLALFNEMQMKERNNFLLCSNDDVDDSLTKLKHLPDFKVNIPVRGECSDLLNGGGEKSDYDWLLTPPETPLFPSLDDEEPPPISLVSRGRSRTQPITISTSSVTSHRSSRSSASPHRLSPSPRSGHNLSQSRGRPSSAPHSRAGPILRPATPSRRPSTPPNKPSTPTPRSSTPTPGRMNTFSGGNTSSRRGASPINASRGNSASPKLRGWQTNIPGFSSEPPPNLRTSLPDRLGSRARGSSPGSRNGRDSSLRSGRQSMSPTASGSVSSFHSNDRDHFSSNSKGSVASSGDDDADLERSVNLEISASPTLRKNGVFVTSRNSTFSKKPFRNISANSAPQRSFDSALRQMDQHKTPQNMFRPLLSSVPASTFYIGKSNNTHRPIFSRNSSLTTSSNASSEHCASLALDTEGSEHDQNEFTAEWEKASDTEGQEEGFGLDKMDGTEDIGNEVCRGEHKNIQVDVDEHVLAIMEPEGPEQQISDLADIKVTLHLSEISYSAGDHSNVEFSATLCSKCNKIFQMHEALDGIIDICQDCAKRAGYVTDGIHTTAVFEGSTLVTSQNSDNHPNVAALVDEPCKTSHSESNVLQDFQSYSETIINQPQIGVEPTSDCFPDVCPVEEAASEKEQWCKNSEYENEVVFAPFTRGGKFQRFYSFGASQCSRIDCLEGAGTSVLLTRSSSGKLPVVQGRSLTAASMACVEQYYTKDNFSTLKGLVLRDSSSASSSMNLGSSRQSETGIQRQLSSSSADMVLNSGPRLKSQSSETFPLNNLREGLACRDNLSRSVDNANPLNGYVTPETLSSSSSIDLGSSRQFETHIGKQLNSSKIQETIRKGLHLNRRSTEMILTEISINSQENLGTCIYRSEEKFCGSTENVQDGACGGSVLAVDEYVESCENTEYVVSHSLSAGTAVPIEAEITQHSGELGTSFSELASDVNSAHLEKVPASDALTDEDCVSSAIAEDHHLEVESFSLQGMPATSDSCPIEEHGILNEGPCKIENCDIALQSLSGTLLGVEDDCDTLKCSSIENDASHHAINSQDASNAHPVPKDLVDTSISEFESNNIEHAHVLHGESTVTIEGPGGNKGRSLTLEEATDTILFCNSIVHDLAFNAVATAMEKEHPPVAIETRQPSVMLSGMSVPEDEDQRKAPSKRTPKPLKAKKNLQMDATLPAAETASVAKDLVTRAPYNSELPRKAGTAKPKLESKCNCTVM